ncbi:hypothetical protein GCM10007979_29550 [Nocardioides albus]|nr:hypothetical protein GCM10007979_29550 [Nocardioides albus]
MTVDFSAPISGAGLSAAAGPDMARMVVAAPTAVTVAAASAQRRWVLWGRFMILLLPSSSSLGLRLQGVTRMPCRATGRERNRV